MIKPEATDRHQGFLYVFIINSFSLISILEQPFPSLSAAAQVMWQLQRCTRWEGSALLTIPHGCPSTLPGGTACTPCATHLGLPMCSLPARHCQLTICLWKEVEFHQNLSRNLIVELSYLNWQVYS